MNPSLLVDELVDRGLVTRAAVDRVVASGKHKGKATEVALVDEGLVAEDEVLGLMSELFGIPYRHITPQSIDNRLADEMPKRFLTNFCVYPLQRADDSEVQLLATVDPFDVTVADIIRQMTGREVNYVLVPRKEIEAAIDGKLVGSSEFHSLAALVPTVPGWDGLGSMLESESSVLSENSSPIIKLVNSILREAVRLKASDIHIEPQEKNFRVRYRVDGLLTTMAELPKRAERTCVSRIKILSNIDISDTRSAKDGRISLTALNGKVDLRVSTVPSAYGEKVVMRILDQAATKLELSQLGFGKKDLQTLSHHLMASSGMILITGPTGSGKTSTLYAALRMLNTTEVNIVTVEDPVEFQLEGLTQVQTNPRAGLTFANTLRAFLRQDPDIIMVGEIRDQETATTAVQAAQSGHLVLSTLHTSNSPATLSRLVLLGVMPHQVASGLLCVVAQRLVRRLCTACKRPVTLKEEHSILLDLAVEQRFPRRLFEAKGCHLCGGSGYKGRLGLYEILTINSALHRQIILDPREEELWKVARQEGMKTLLEDGLDKVEEGATSLEEVLRVVTIRRRSTTSDGQSDPTTSASQATPTSLVVPHSNRARTVGEIMVKSVITLDPRASLDEAVTLLAFKGITGCPVVDEKGTVVGLVSHSDLASVLAKARRKPQKKPKIVEDIMSRRVITVSPEDTLIVAAQKMWRHKIHRVVVMHEGQLVGIMTPFDLMLQTSLFQPP